MTLRPETQIIQLRFRDFTRKQIAANLGSGAAKHQEASANSVDRVRFRMPRGEDTLRKRDQQL
jgi:hypothetical protein